MKLKIKAALAAIVLIVAAVPTLANEITLKNGDRVSGKIVSRTDEAVVIETEYAGTLTINAEFISGITEEDAPDSEAAAAVEPPPATPPAAAPEPQRIPKIFGEGPLYGLGAGWDGNANVGLSYTSGNSRTTTMTTGIRAVKNGGNDKLTVYARSLWHSNRNSGFQVTTQNAVWGGLRYDRNLNDRVFGFASYDFERDRPKGLNLRSVIGAGLGHHTIKRDDTELEMIVGGAWNRSWQRGPNTDTPEAFLGNTLKHKFHERIRIQQSFTVSQNITDRNEYRFIFDATLSADVTKRIGWFITLGDRFNNDPAGMGKKNDLLLTTGMRWNFGRK
jgi:putative salt-induced outer membrane protein